jgi:predicted  nucleic acid-binding Zn-ribbon protein
MSGIHKHKCDRCGAVWQHPDTCFGDERSHLCPNCGEEQTWKYFGNEKADYIQRSKNSGFEKVDK